MSVLEELATRSEEAEQRVDSAKARRVTAMEALEELRASLKDPETGEDRELTEEEKDRSAKLLAEHDQADAEAREARKRAKKLAKRIKEEKRDASRKQQISEARENLNTPTGGIQVTSEPMIYGEGSENSFYLDHARRVHAMFGQALDGGATDRLNRWAHQVEREFADGSKFGKQVEVQLREQFRELARGGDEPARRAVKEARERGRVALEDKPAELRVGNGQVELRTVATGGGATASAAGGGGAAFVTPVFYVAKYAPFREFGRAFIDQCNKQQLPDYGMTIYIPKVTGAAEVAEQTEGSGVAEKTPTYGFLSGALITEAGEVVVTQQLLDRAGPNFGFDQLIFDQLQRDYAPKVDKYVLTKALEEAIENTGWTGNGGSFVLIEKEAAGGLYGQVSKLKGEIRKGSGTVLNPTHVFMDPARWEQVAAYGDVNARPVVVPDYAGPFNAAAAGSSSGDVGIEGATGYRFNGLPAFHDANIPTFGTTGQDEVVVGCLSEVYVYEGTPTTRAIPQTYANELRVILQQYSYITAIKRYAKAIGMVTGTALKAPVYTH